MREIWTDPRYTEHATFNQQLLLPMLLSAIKQDLYQPQDRAAA